MAKKFSLMGKKCGMTQVFDNTGVAIACTVLSVAPNVVAQIKTQAEDGYNALQLGCDEIKVNHPDTMAKRVNKPQLGHFKKGGIAPHRHLFEVGVESIEAYTLGQKLGLELFQEFEFVDATSVSKGKGFQGVIKRHHFAGGPASHGSGFHRHGGSTGMRTSPGRCLPGQKMPGRMGGEQVTVQSLKVVSVDLEEQLILVAGGVPGPIGGMVMISTAEKKRGKKATEKKPVKAKK